MDLRNCRVRLRQPKRIENGPHWRTNHSSQRDRRDPPTPTRRVSEQSTFRGGYRDSSHDLLQIETVAILFPVILTTEHVEQILDFYRCAPPRFLRPKNLATWPRWSNPQKYSSCPAIFTALIQGKPAAPLAMASSVFCLRRVLISSDVLCYARI